MSTLHIHLLGDFRLTYADAPVSPINAPRLQSLLAYLVLHRDAPQPRYHLAFLLWPDTSEGQARTNLRQLVHSLKQALPDADQFVCADSQTLQWRSDTTFYLDVVEFEEALSLADGAEHQGDVHSLRKALEQAISVYQGDLLPSCYDDWIVQERERLRQALAVALERLILLLERQGEPRAALAYAQRLLRHDPLREETYRGLMRLHAVSGDRAGVRRVYQTCAMVLERELAVEPSAATREAYQQLMRVADQARPVMPPPRSNTNLPVPLTSFIGREAEMSEVTALLQTTRLLTLTGPGGCGKTRLALEAATRQVKNYPDGVWWVELAALADPSLVPQAVATALGAREQAGAPLMATLAEYLCARHLLLLLDNCEHLISACAHLAEYWLSACPRLRILATSREALSIGGETAWPVPSLSLSEATSTTPFETLSRSEAVRLFVERAATVLPTFRLTAANGPQVAHICRRLDGIPLAIELAAARVKVLSVEEFTARLDNVFQLLTTGRRTALPRHQTLRAAMEWSYDLLSDQEQTLFRRSSVFVGGFELATAEKVCADPADGWIPPSNVLDLLSHLVDKSLIIVEQIGTESRYRMLETIREYASQKLIEAGESERMFTRHLEFFLQVVENHEQLYANLSPAELLASAEREHDNLRAALLWSQQAEARVEMGLRLAVALWPFWQLRAHFSEARDWLKGLLARASSLSRSPHRATALRALASFERNLGDYHRARAHLEESLAIVHELADESLLARTLRMLGEIASLQSDYGTAEAYYAQSLTLFRALGDHEGTAQTLMNQASLAMSRGEYERVRKLVEESIAISRQMGYAEADDFALVMLGNAALGEGDLARARAFYEESLAIRRRLNDKRRIATVLGYLGSLARREHDYIRATLLCQEAVALDREIGTKPDLAANLLTLGLVACDQGDCLRAMALLRESLTLRRAIDERRGKAECLTAMAYIAITCGQPDRAVRLLAAGLSELEALGVPKDPGGRPDVERTMAITRARLDEQAFSAAWAEGQAMTLEEAIADTLSVIAG